MQRNCREIARFDRECQTCETTNESERREPGKKAEGEAGASRAEKGRWVELEK
jgi:hypothetical protein